MKYVVKQIIDRYPVGEDVTRRYAPEVAQRLVQEGYLEVVNDEPTFEPEYGDDDAEDGE